MENGNIRVAFRMRVSPGQEAEYIDRHNPIWSELETALKQHGVVTYSIYLDRATNDLFAYAEVSDLEQWQAIASTSVCQKWWVSMAPLMPTNADNSPVVGELEEIFHIEAEA
ncbi:MAG: L-rhamnose mutarotase [Pirellulales bacterium]